mmetsp:Transcript_12468/g.31396  ORF Transcript_12468/g.31396 Transcript_12468/m.31396 type:complete len:392 (+) Transcript_12468:58-1233(+)
MSDEKDDNLPTIDSYEIESQTLNSNSESMQPLPTVEAILVSEDESGLPPSSPEEQGQSENHRPVKDRKKQQGRQKEQKTRQKKKRHGARNQHRHKFFVKWLISTFDLEQSSISSISTVHSGDSNSIASVGEDKNKSDDNDVSDVKHNPETDDCDKNATVDDKNSSQDSTCATRTSYLYQEPHILDVAGGRGEVSARLTMCHTQRVVMVDPRPADIVDCFERIVLPKIPNKWQRRLEEQRKGNPDFVQNKVESRFQQLVTTFDSPKIMFDMKDDNIPVPTPLGSRSDLIELQAAVQHATLIVGLHADGATEAIVDAALKYNKPFVVVPCCVFPNFFPMRRLIIDQKDGGPPQTIPVRSHEQFCTYLHQKDPRFVMEELPFEGRNIAIWWDGK